MYPLPLDFDEDKLASEMKRLELVKTDKTKDEPSGDGPKLRSTAPSADGAGYGARPGSLHRVFLMRDVVTREMFRYGFAEFWTLADALAALKKVQMTRAFSIAGEAVTIASIHMGVFIPEERELTADIEPFSFRPLFNPAIRVRYRDLDLYPSQKIVAPEAPAESLAETAQATAAPEQKGDGQKAKKRKADGAPAAAESSAVKKPVAMAAQMAFWKRRHDEIRAGGGSGGEDAGPEEGAGKGPDRATAPIKFSLSTTTKAGSADSGTTAGLQAEGEAEAKTAEVSFVDRDRLMCLICMMRYKSVDEVNIHERSRNHRRATEDDDKVQAALPRIAVRDKRLTQSSSDAALYRDRAKERREAHNQPANPPPAPAAKPKPAEAAPTTAGDEAKKPPDSKGAGMLAKMGWASGAGLGAQGAGLTEAITAQAYKGGVGLGAEGGKLGDAADVARGRTKDSYADYLAAAQDKARERYNQMG